MKKAIFFLMCSITTLVCNAQLGWDKHWDIKANEQGQFHFQLGVAVPLPNYNSDSSTFGFKTARVDAKSFNKYKDVPEDNNNLYGAGPFYARFEYSFNRKLSVNAGITYTQFKESFTRDSLDAGTGVFFPYEYGVNVSNLSYIARLNYHLYVDTRWDVYCGAGMGYDTYTSKSYSKYPPQSLIFNAYFKNPPPVTFEAGAGFRYFFLNRTAFYLEAGYGKTYLHAGVIVKVSQPKINRSY